MTSLKLLWLSEKLEPPHVVSYEGRDDVSVRAPAYSFQPVAVNNGVFSNGAMFASVIAAIRRSVAWWLM